MIYAIAPLPIGNAVHLFVRAPAGAVRWATLRATSPDDLTGYGAPGVTIVDEGRFTASVDLDVFNGTTYYYAFAWNDGTTWYIDPPASVIPACITQETVPDPLLHIRDRIEMGLESLIARGLVNVPPGTSIRVMTAPPQYGETAWPVVTVHCREDASADRAIGEAIVSQDDDSPDSEGWLASYRAEIIAWSLNPDERISLRQALKHVVIGNLPVFDALGFLRVDLQMSDTEDFDRYSAPVYQAVATLSFQIQTPIAWAVPRIRVVERVIRLNGEEDYDN
jgi:hypothetical protein